MCKSVGGRNNLALAPALVETYCRLLVFSEIESLGIKGLLNQLLPLLFKPVGWGILHVVLEMFSYRLNYIQAHFRLSLLNHLQTSVMSSPHHNARYFFFNCTKYRLYVCLLLFWTVCLSFVSYLLLFSVVYVHLSAICYCFQLFMYICQLFVYFLSAVCLLFEYFCQLFVYNLNFQANFFSFFSRHPQLNICMESCILRLITGLGNAEITAPRNQSQGGQGGQVQRTTSVLYGESEELNRVVVLTLARAIHIHGYEQQSAGYFKDVLASIMNKTPHYWPPHTLNNFPPILKDFYNEHR